MDIVEPRQVIPALPLHEPGHESWHFQQQRISIYGRSAIRDAEEVRLELTNVL